MGKNHSHGINVFFESWEGPSPPMLIFSRAYGQIFKICHHQMFSEMFLNICSSPVFFNDGFRSTVNPAMSR